MAIPEEYGSDIERSDGSVESFTLGVFVARTFRGTPESVDETVPEWVPVGRVSEKFITPDLPRIVRDGLKIYEALADNIAVPDGAN